VRARALERAAQTVRYLRRPVIMEGKPALLTTYLIWEWRKPRTFSFVRQERRTDLARIVRVDETARLVTVLVPSRGVVLQVRVPLDVVVAYSQALQVDPPSLDLVARADEVLHPGEGGVVPQPIAELPVEQVAGMREVLGRVRRVERETRLVTLEGVPDKTPFRVPEDAKLPKVGDYVSLAIAPDGTVSPPVATRIAPLQPTVEGVLTRVQPLAVELSVRTMTPDGQIAEVPVPVSQDSRVYMNGKPGSLKALKEGLYIRAYITPTGETRIVGEDEGVSDDSTRRHGGTGRLMR
jgi:hypothetical protein